MLSGSLTALATQIGVLTALISASAVLLLLARRRYQPRQDPVVEAIEALLPQTQCAQCGYPGCRPYAEAVAAGAAIDLCPPGGRRTQLGLATLLGRQPGISLPPAAPAIARIDEAQCIGCFLCVEACPVDAIVGAPRFMHTVLEDRCTGCELCLAPCPVDCIELLGEPGSASVRESEPVAPASTDCIRCNRCEPVCPADLPVQHLWWFSRADDLSQALAAGLDQCIECGLCNPECPSGLDLLGTFQHARHRRTQALEAEAAAALARQHVDERERRLARTALIASDRRSQRLAALKTRR